jgi:hypothetical protein
MRTSVPVFFCFLVLPVVASSTLEDASAFVQEVSNPLQEIIIPKAHEWAASCLPGLCAQDKAMVCRLLNISCQFADADLKLKKAVRCLFDGCCIIQDSAQRFVGITESTENLQRVAAEVDWQVKVYNANLGDWNKYIEGVNRDNNGGVLNALHDADCFTTMYINAFLQQGRGLICHELNNTIAANLGPSESVRNMSLSLLDSLKSLRDGTKDSIKDFDDIMSSSFELARVHFCNEVKAIMTMRELFEIQEELLALRKVVAGAFYEAALSYCDADEQEQIGA